jgi:hypothetical protein
MNVQYYPAYSNQMVLPPDLFLLYIRVTMMIDE